MKTEDIVEHLKLQDSNLDFYKKKVAELESQIKDIKQISDISNSVNLGLKKTEYTREEIISAYNKMLKYEGLESRSGGLIVDTFIEFLNGTHHSLNNISVK